MRRETRSILFLALFLGAALQSVTADRVLLKSASAESVASSSSDNKKGTASADASAVSTGGTASAVAIATSETYKEVADNVAELCITIIAALPPFGPGFCKSILVEFDKELEAVGRAFVSAYSSAFADTAVTGTGSACANAAASAQEQATAFASALINAVAIAVNSVSFAKAEAAVGAQSVVFAKVFTEAFSSACTTGGIATAEQQSFAEAIIEPIATVLVWLAAAVDCSGAEGFSESAIEAEAGAGTDEVNTGSEGFTNVVGVGDANSGGSADAVTGDVDSKCTGKYMFCCSFKFRDSDTCPCTLSNNPSSAKCAATKVSGGSKTVWVDDDADTSCVC